jgi:hypothetical protein
MSMATTTSIENEQVRVYALASPTLLKQEESAIEQIFFEMLRISDRGRHKVEISESSGWISYIDIEELWRRKTPPRLPDGPEAKKRGNEFLRALTSALSPSNRRIPDSLRTMILLPVNNPVEIVKVPRPDGSIFDHWLYRFQPKLLFGRQARRFVPVLGTQIELRIGENGQIIGFLNRWRPITDEHVYTPLIPFDSQMAGHHNNIEHNEEISSHMPVYVFDGDGIPQHYLSPYYLVNEGHIFSLVSACAYSLNISYNIKAGIEGETIVTAVVMGGSGQYIFNWAVYVIDNIWEEPGIRGLGDGSAGEIDVGDRIKTSTITLPTGVYNVLVNVKDQRTGAFKHHQQLVYSFPILAEDPPESPLVA